MNLIQESFITSRRKLSQVKKKFQLTVYSNMELSKLTVKWTVIREQLEGEHQYEIPLCNAVLFSINWLYISNSSISNAYLFPFPIKTIA